MLYLFKTNCQLIQELIPLKKSLNSPVSIVSVDIDDEINRIACLLNDNSISFWDLPNLDFELNVTISNHELPIKVFYSYSLMRKLMKTITGYKHFR